MTQSKAFNVYVPVPCGWALVDTVWYTGSAAECRDSLINHDNYAACIHVTARRLRAIDWNGTRGARYRNA